MPKTSFLDWDEEGINTVAKTWSLSEEEKKDLIELGKRVEGVDWKDDIDGTCGRNGPNFLVRYLASGKSVDEAERRYRQLIEYGKELGVETLVADGFEPPDEVKDYMPLAVLDGNDYAGDPVMIRRIPDIQGLLDAYGKEKLMKYALFSSIARMHPNEWEATNKRLVQRMIFIDDMKGLNRSLLTREVLAFHSQMTTMQQELHPEGLKKIVVVNAPRIFSYAYGLVKIFIKKRVREKVVICSSPEMARKVLSQYMDLAVLPSCVLPEGKGKSNLPFPKNFNGGPFRPSK